MQILVVGATGGTGLATVGQALDRGHYVTAFVRDPARLPLTHPHLTVVTGDVLDPNALLPAVRRQDAVICSLGGRPGQSDRAVADGTVNLIAAMKQASVNRLLVVSSLGVGDSFAGASLPSKLFIRTVLSGPIAQKEEQEQAVRGSGLDYLIVRPPRLTNDPATGQIAVAESMKFPLFAMPRISRSDVAAFLLDQLDSSTYVGKMLIVTGK